jgi:DNA-binding NarL/FixJ family response regulator
MKGKSMLPSDQTQIRCFLVDDHPLFVSVLIDLLKADARFLVAGSAHTGNDMLRELRACPVDLVVLDLQLPDISGIELIGLIRAEGLARKILVCSGLTSDEAIEVAFALGADAFIQKTAGIDELLATLLATAEDRMPMNAHVGRVFREMIRFRQARLELRPRDFHVLIGLAEHKNVKLLALELGVTASAIYKTKHRIAQRFDVRDLTDLRGLAARLGLVPYRDRTGQLSIATDL